MLQRDNLQELNLIERQRHAAVWLPHGLFETVKGRLEAAEGGGPLGPVRRQFLELLEHHRTLAATDSQLLVANRTVVGF
eukprot:9338442-Pyramimonas_sp.AAC.1